MIRSVSMRNFCQHEDSTFEFHNRMTAIIGANGSGKSNIFAAIIGALVNEWVTAGKKEANVTYGSKGAAHIELSLTHNGVDATVRRILKGEVSALKIGEDKKVITGEDQITESLLDMLGISKRMLMDYILVRQGTISGILSATTAERAKSFQRLFGTERCEGIYAACLPVITKLSVPFDASREEAALKMIDEIEQGIFDVDSELASLRDDIPSDETIKLMKTTLIEIENRSRIEETINETTDKLSPAKDLLSKLENDLTEVKSVHEKRKNTVKTLGSEAEEARVMIRMEAEFRKAWEARAQRLAEIDSLTKERDSLTEPTKPNVESIPVGEEERLIARLDTLRTLSGTIDPDTGIGTCPLCLTDGVDLSKRLTDSLEEEKEIEEQLKNVRKSKAALEKYAALLNSYSSRYDVITARIEERQSIVTSETLPTKPESGEWEEVIASYNNALEDEAKHKEMIDEITLRIEKGKSLIATYNDTIANAKLKLAKIPEPYEDEETLRAEIEKLNAQLIEQATLEGKLSSMQSQLALHEKSLVDIAADKKKHEQAEKLSVTLNNVRNAFHRDGIPAQVSRTYLNAITNPTGRGSSINELLEIFEAPFYVTVNEEDLSFIAHFNDGRVQPAERLSGGEKVVLSLALRTSVNALFASHLSMLFLDEPTEYLDENNLVCLRTALEKLGELAEDRGLQVVVITHEANLAPLFDKVIEL